MARFNIGGRIFFTGNSVNIVNGKVTIDGVIQDETLNGIVEIRITEGVLGELKADGSVTCGEVQGNVSAGVSVNSGNIGGSVNAGGSVRCGNISGSAMAGGSVRHC